MEITVQVRLAPAKQRAKAFASVQMENGLLLQNVRIFDDEAGEAVVFPQLAIGNQRIPLLFKDKAYKTSLIETILREYHRVRSASPCAEA